MASHFCLSVRLLDSTFHGQGDGGRPEWPPSPLRVFQALVAAAARRNGGEISGPARAALEWLENRAEPPVIVAPPGERSAGYRLSVPNNAMDVVAAAWARGNDSNTGDANPATHRTMKAVRPVLLEEDLALRYAWPLPEPASDEVPAHIRALSDMAGSVAALGWGVDLAIGHGEVLASGAVERLPGERWLPAGTPAEDGLRVPVPGTLEDLIRHHDGFLRRVTREGFVPPPPLAVYRKVQYRSALDPAGRKLAVFALLDPETGKRRPFDTARWGLTVAGMMRGAVKDAAGRSEWSSARIASFVLGHGEADGSAHVAVGPRRFAYIPLPTLEARSGTRPTAAGIRRIMLTAFADNCEDDIAWARRMLAGHELRNEKTNRPEAVLEEIPAADTVVRFYTQSAAEWATVTPMVLPGYDDPKHYRRRIESGIPAAEERQLLLRLDARIDALIRKAIVQAGFSNLLADNAEIDWRKAGFWPGAELADRYGVPDHLKRFARYHVRLRWRDAQGKAIKLRGPICLGGGRYYGLGLFAAVA